MTEALFDVLKANYGDELVGMSAGGNELTVTLKDKTVVITDYENKTIVEIIEEINNE